MNSQKICIRNLIMFIILCRFKIHVKVKDGTGEATLMLLDWTAQGIVPETALNLLDGSFDEVYSIS